MTEVNLVTPILINDSSLRLTASRSNKITTPTTPTRTRTRTTTTTCGGNDKNKIKNKFQRQRKIKKEGISHSISHIRTDSCNGSSLLSTPTSPTPQTPSHHTMSSLALLAANNPQAMDELTRVSVDMRLQREIDRLQKCIQQKESQFQSALEIADQLNVSNTKLKNQCTALEEQLLQLQSENRVLQTKSETIEDRYEKDMQQLQSHVDEQSQMIMQLQQDLFNKEKILKTLEEQQHMHIKEKFFNGDTFTRLDNGYSLDTPIGDSQTKREREMRKQLEEEIKRSNDLLKERNQLCEKLEEMSKVHLLYETSQRQHQEYEQNKEAEIIDYLEATKSMSREVVVLASQNSRLEQRVEELQQELKQRVHEIELLSQANVIQTRQLRCGTTYSQLQGEIDETLAGLGQCSETFIMSPREDDLIECEYTPDALLQPPSDDIVTKTLTQEGVNLEIDNDNGSNVTKKMTEKDKDEFVADVIKEYLHLSASSVKIKYPSVVTISNEILIDQTKHLPFYQYHDFMVRIMEKELKRMEEEKKKKQEEETLQRKRSPDLIPSKTKGRRSLLGNFFGLFSGREETGNEDKEVSQVKEIVKPDDITPTKENEKNKLKTSTSDQLVTPAGTKLQPFLMNSQTDVARQTSISLVENDKTSDDRTLPIMKADNSHSVDHHIDEILDAMELTLNELDDEELISNNNLSTRSARSLSMSPIPGENPTENMECTLPPSLIKNDSHNNMENVQSRRVVGRSAISRALSRR